MMQCGACATAIEGEGSLALCRACGEKRLTCRVCGHEFGYRDIVDDLPVVQCPVCEGRAIEVTER